jgi:hypothetical protein
VAIAVCSPVTERPFTPTVSFTRDPSLICPSSFKMLKLLVEARSPKEDLPFHVSSEASIESAAQELLSVRGSKFTQNRANRSFPSHVPRKNG